MDLVYLDLEEMDLEDDLMDEDFDHGATCPFNELAKLPAIEKIQNFAISADHLRIIQISLLYRLGILIAIQV